MPPPMDPPTPFTDLRVGDRARLAADRLADADHEMLRALGLTPIHTFRVARAGHPWIVHVHGTRIGLADAVARNLRVIVEPAG